MNGSTGAQNLAKCKLYYAKIYDKDTNALVRDFIPVLDQDNVACLYDLVEEKAYYNMGTGTFTAGSATGDPVSIGGRARKLRKGYVGINSFLYTALDYIESTGTQYIDTNISTNSNTKVEIEVMFDNANLQECIWCGRDFNSSNTGINNDTLFKIANGIFRVDYGSIGNNFSHSINTATKYKYVQDKNKLYENDVLIYTSSATTFTTTNKLRLLAARNGDGSTNSFFNGKIYSIKIYDNDTLTRNFIPVVDGHNVACLYELMEGKFYYNQGTGAFTAGSATGQPVFIGEKARRIKKGYVGDSNGIARLCFRGYGETPEYRLLATGQTTQKYLSAIVGTKDYMLEIGGGETGSSTPVKTAKAYDASGVATNAVDLPTQAWFSAAVKFDGLAIVAGGKTANSGASRTDQCIVYTNNLTRQSLTTLSNSLFSPAAAATTSHFFVAGGSNYYQWQARINAYDSSFVKSTPASMSVERAIGNLASIGNYIVCCGGFQYTGAVNFYDDSNVKTTSSDPYGKITQFPLGLSTNSHAVFFGGATGSSAADAYTDCKAYDTNKVLTSFNLPVAIWRAQGFSNGNYAVVCYQANELVYDDNLVLVSRTTTRNYGYGDSYMSGTADDFAMVKRNGTTELNIFDI